MSSLRLLKRFKLSHIGNYLKNLPDYAKGFTYWRYMDILKEEGAEYGVIKGTNEQYVFDINDECIPGRMHRERQTYSENDINDFFELAGKISGRRPQKGGYFLDIGANIGTTSVYVAKNVMPSMPILAFEPDKRNFDLLRVNCILNGCENIQSVNIALSDQRGSMQMLVNEANRANSKVVQGKAAARQEEEKGDKIECIQTYRLDDWLKEQNIKGKDIDFIWMDIEGHETYAVKGMMELLANYKPPVFMEFTAHENPSVTVSEEEFSSLYEHLSSVYKKVIIPKLDKNKEFSIEYLTELFFESNKQYNIFLF